MSLGKSESSSDASSVWDAQSPYLQGLYERAGNNLDNNPGASPEYWYGQNIKNMATPAYQQMLGGGLSGQFAQNPYLQAMASGQMQNQALGGAIDSGLNTINQNFNENIMPGINAGAAMTNTSGGSRQGIAQGVAARGANQEASNFVNNMLSNNFQGQMQNQLGALGQMGQAYGMADQYSGQALGMAGQMQNLGFNPTNNYWASVFSPYHNYSSIMGNPTVLGGGSEAYSWNAAMPKTGG